MDKNGVNRDADAASNRKRRKKYRFGAFARRVLGRIFPRKYNIEYSYDENIKGIEPPYFLFGNHTNVLDPFLMGIGAPHHVNYVANDEYFRKRPLAFLMKMLGAIPKTKFMSDHETVKNIFKLRDANDVIGIYPEGGRTWQGRTQPLLFSTSKLVKKLKIPVMCALTAGGSLSFPRWAKKFRKGKILIRYSLVLTAEEIESMTAGEIHERLTAALAHDETAWNREAKIAFKGKRPAEHLEWYIYACPKCGRLETMVSKKDKYTCRACGYSVKYNEYGLFEGVDGSEAVYDNVTDWGAAQYKTLKGKVAILKENEPLLKRGQVILYQGKRRARVLGRIMRGTLTFTGEGFKIENGTEARTFNYKDVRGLTINYKNVIDFYDGDEKLRLEFFRQKGACGFIWEDAMKALKESGT